MHSMPPRPRGTSFFLFTFAGLLAWNLFSATLSKTSLSLVGNSYLISKVYFPRLILPLSGALSTLLDFTVSAAVLLIVQALLGILQLGIRDAGIRDPKNLGEAP